MVNCLLVLLILLVTISFMFFRLHIQDFVIHYIRRSQYKANASLYPILDSMPRVLITRNSIPYSLQTRMAILNIPNFERLKCNKQKTEVVMQGLCASGVWPATCRSDLVVFNAVYHSGGYFPSIHTDQEWNRITNEGFQVWCLEYNRNASKIGNMFIFENSYLDAKYKNTKYSLRVFGDEIVVFKNCLGVSTLSGTIKQKFVLDRLSVEFWKATTKMYYLDVEPGDCVVFDNTVAHMSDYRDKTKLRKAFNFRVAIKNLEKQLHYNKQSCGYVHSTRRTLDNPSMYQLVD